MTQAVTIHPAERGQGMVTLRVPAVLRPMVDGRREISCRANTFGEFLTGVRASFPNLVEVLTGGTGELSPFVNVYVNGLDVRSTGGLLTPLRPGDEVMLLVAIVGG